MALKILHAIQCLTTGGAGRAALIMARWSRSLGGHGHRIVSLLPADPRAVDLAREADVEVLSAPGAEDLDSAIASCDVLLVHWWNSPEMAEFLHRPLPAARVALWLHVGGRAAPQILVPELVEGADHAAACSPFTWEHPLLQRIHREQGPDKVSMIFAAADIDRFLALQPIAHQGVVAGYAGTVDWTKMHPAFVELCAATTSPDLRFEVCGGPLQAEVGRKALGLGLGDRMLVRGPVPDVAPHMAAWDLFAYPLCPDTYAASELVLQEAMASGLPPVVFPFGGVSRLVEDGRTGLVAHDEAAFTRAVDALARDPQERARLGAAARAHAAEQFHPRRWAQAWNERFERMVSEPRRARPEGLVPRRGRSWGRLFADALGPSGAVFSRSLEGGLDAVEADREIGAAPDLVASSTSGGILQYRQRHPEDAHLRLWSALVLENRGRLSDAAGEVVAAIEGGLADARTLLHAGRIAVGAGGKDAARGCLQKALAMEPDLAPAKDLLRSLGEAPRRGRGITVVVYGRNDSHGQNLTKRAVISLNCLALELDPGLDEILFVDCNSPDDVPTFLEANRDLLTPRARALVRVLRLRPRQFRPRSRGAKAPVLEGLSRNVALRRSSPERPWILSTNTDIVVRTKDGRRLTEVVADLEDGLYGAPRFDLPQGLWETLDRTAPEEGRRRILGWADRFGLRNSVRAPWDFVRWDNPGDFQLFPRADLVAIGGFDESMVDGPYHVDSNMARRLCMRRGGVRSLEPVLEVFHCDHSRQAMARQTSAAVKGNDWNSCVAGVANPDLSAVQPDWGAADETIEEIRLEAPDGRLEAALAGVVPADGGILSIDPGFEPESNVHIPLGRLLPFLVDHLLQLPARSRIGVLSQSDDLPRALRSAGDAMGRNFQIERLDPEDGDRASRKADGCAVVVVDPGTRNGPVSRELLAARMVELALRQSRIATEDRSRFLLLMPHQSWLGALGREFFDLHFAPTDTWLFHGAAKDPERMPERFRTLEEVPVADSPKRGPRIGFDGRTLCSPDSVVRGIGHYALYHLEALVAIRPGADLVVLVDDRSDLDPEVRRRLNGLGVRTAAWSSKTASDFDLVHTPDPMCVHPGVASPFHRFSGTRLSATFHDVIPLRMYRGGVPNWAGYLARLDELSRFGVRLLCNSEFTRKDLLDAVPLDPEKVEVAGSGFNASPTGKAWSREDGDRVLARLGIDRPFLLHVGTADPHKNIESVVAVGRALAARRGVQLVLAGRLTHSLKELQRQVREAGWQDVVFTDYVPREELELLYSRAVATLFLSRYEGFGFPALEAMACGCPLICSNAASLPEVAGGAGRLHGPDDLEGVVRSAMELMDDGDLRKKMVEAGRTRASRFLWSDVARRTWDSWDRALERPAPARVECPPPAKVQWISPVWDPSGYADEARAFVRHLAGAGLAPSLLAVGRHSDAFRLAASPEDRAILDGAMGRELAPGFVAVLDVPGSALGRVAAAARMVGRTTFETDSLPAEWVVRCNSMDEIWVPCGFNRETFRRAGVTVPVLVVPEGVDSGRFRPGLEPLPLPGPARGTTFLSVFEWTRRKGPDVLLEAWARAFGPDDDVRLVVRTYPPNAIEGDPRAWVEERIDAELARVGRRRTDCAPIVVLASQVPDADMPRLYAASDVYVAPSRGEGWGRPHMEAMGCGVPVIATRWSGNLEFQNDDNSWLIAVDGLEAIDEREEFPGYKGQNWAVPSVSDLQRLLREAAGDPLARRYKGVRARADIVAKWDWSRIGRLAETRLREILEGIPPERSALAAGYEAASGPRPTGAGPAIRWVGPVFNYSGYARQAREAIGALEADGFRCTVDPLSSDPEWFLGLKGEPGEMARWKGILSRPQGDEGVLVVCDVPRSADGKVDLLEQVRGTYPDISRRVVWTLFETDSLPRGWVETLNRMDQVWVSSRHNLSTFAAAGVEPGRLRLVPCGIDPAPFDRARGRPLEIPGSASTTFLSVFQWSLRKGWDVLLDAWSKAFGPDDDVRLVLRCHGASGEETIEERLDAWLASRGLGRGALAPIVLVDEFVAEPDMPRLYEACDVVVQPSRGEGWGIPSLEAMAAGKPVIGVPWAGSADFLHEGVGWMLPPGNPVPVSQDAIRENPFLDSSHRWADPKVEDLVAALRAAAASPQERRHRGERGREEQRRLWGPATTARAIRAALDSAETEPKTDPASAPAVLRLLPRLQGRIPIAMPAYNRDQYLVETLAALRECRDLDRFFIVTGEEPGCPGTKALFDAVDWMPIVRNIHPERLGCNGNVLGVADRACTMADRFVLLEDDLVPGKDFLSYLLWGLDRFRGDPSVFGLTGCFRGSVVPEERLRTEAHFADWFTGWGWASWRDRWEQFRRDVWVPSAGSVSWDVFLCKWVVEIAGLKEVRPSVGRIQNIGEVGTWVPSPEWQREHQQTRFWVGNLGWEPVARGDFHLAGEDPPARPLPAIGNRRLSGALAGVASGLRARRQEPPTHRIPAPAPASDAFALPDVEGADGHLSIRWEGSQFLHHSLAHVNRELCAGIAKSGQDLSLIPYEPDQFGPGDDPDLGILAQLTNAPLEGPCQVHVRHQWPPNLTPPPEGRWVVIQPWEFGSPPRAWMPAFRDLVDELWVPSRYCRDLYVSAGCDPQRVHVVPNGVDTDRFRPGLVPLSSLPAKKGLRFLFVGGTIARKGFDRLLEAWQQAFGPGDRVELLIKDMGGKTSYAGQTGEAKVRALQESGRCATIHYVNDDLPPDQLPGLYASGDVLVHPYRGEGFGLPIAEAMACGLPVIITRGGAADDFCGDDEGWMIPAERKLLPGGKVDQWETVEPAWMLDPDPDALVAALRDAASHPELRAARGANARRRIAENFTWKHATAKALQRLRAVAAKPVRRVAAPVATGVPAPLPSEDLAMLLIEVESAVGRQDFVEAERLSLEAVEAHPSEALAWLMRGMVLRGLGKAGKALEALNRSVENGGGPEVRFEMMALHLQAGKVAPARVQWSVLKDKHAAWVEERRRYHQEQGLPWPPDRLRVASAKPAKGKSPAPPKRRR